MEELVMVMNNILAELKQINKKLDDIEEEILYCSMTDICDQIESLETTITLGENYQDNMISHNVYVERRNEKQRQ